MRNLILTALLLASAFHTAMGGDNLLGRVFDYPWYYTVSNSQATITSYTGAGGAVTIPSLVNGISVVGIGGLGNAPIIGPSVTSLTIPNSVTSIEYGAFLGSLLSTNSNYTLA